MNGKFSLPFNPMLLLLKPYEGMLSRLTQSNYGEALRTQFQPPRNPYRMYNYQAIIRPYR
jgi:hypothetical protein